MKRVLAAALLGGVFLAACSTDKAVTSGIPVACMATPAFRAHLLGLYDEERVWTGLGSNGLVYVVSDSGRGGTWTIAMSSREGVSCAILSGGNAQLNPKTVPERLKVPDGSEN